MQHIVIDPKTQENIDSWLNGEYDEKTKEKIKKLQIEDPEELLNAFYQSMSFGTGGLRGIMGVGINRMNIYTVRAATQGLANYIHQQMKEPSQKKVFIGFDCRNHSKEFAIEAAKVLSANQIQVYLYKNLRPVANISFGVLYYQCIAGIMITASHNPPQYNGYKVYWSYGGQVLPPHDQGIINEVNRVTDTDMVKIEPYPNSKIFEVEEEMDQAYFKATQDYPLHPDDNHRNGQQLKVVYTSLHGGGITMIPHMLQSWGFTHLTIVEEQAKPDGNFPTIQSPNPEEHAALKLGVDRLKLIDGDILLGTDPDTDRLGVVIMHEKKPFFFDGNQIACLLLEHLSRSLKNTFHTPACIKTIVTTELFAEIAKRHQVTCFDVLTGFKYVGEMIHQWEEKKLSGQPFYQFLFGAEESYGYLVGTHVRDKDAIVSAAFVCEAALQMKLQDKTLYDFLIEIYQTYGLFREKLLSLTFEGKDGADKMTSIMQQLRQNPPKQIGTRVVEIVEDYLNKRSFHHKTNEQSILSLPPSDVLRFWLSDKTKIVIRPSGTEPKIKIYCANSEKLTNSSLKAMEAAISACDQRLDTLLMNIQAEWFS